MVMLYGSPVEPPILSPDIPDVKILLGQYLFLKIGRLVKEKLQVCNPTTYTDIKYQNPLTKFRLDIGGFT